MMGIAFISWRQFALPVSRKYLALALFAAAFAAFGGPAETWARENIVGGDLSVGLDYDSNIFKSDLNREGEWRSQFAPQFSFISKGDGDKLSLTYAPQFAYNHRRAEELLSQGLAFLADKEFSSRWKMTVTANYAAIDQPYVEPVTGLGALGTTRNFLRADGATQAEVVRILFPELAWDPARDMALVVTQLQQRYTAAPSAQKQIFDLLNQGAGGARQRYWSSALRLTSAYEFAHKSFLTLGYGFANLDNQAGVMADRMEQAPSLLATYQFNSEWRGEVGYELSATTLDTAEDSTANTAHLQLDYQLSPANLFLWNHSQKQVVFDGLLGDTVNQASHLTWRHGLDRQTVLTTTVTGSYLDHELRGDERSCSLNLGLSRTLDWGSLGVTGNGLAAEANPGGPWDKSRQSWEVGGNILYKVRQNVSATGSFSYGQWDAWSLVLADHYDRLGLKAGLGYEFQRGVTLSLNYGYNLFATESIVLDDYSEHLVALRLATKELWRW